MPHEAGPEVAFVQALGRALHSYGTPAHRLEDSLNRVSAPPYPAALVRFAFAVSGAALSRFQGGGMREVIAAANVGKVFGTLSLVDGRRGLRSPRR